MNKDLASLSPIGKWDNKRKGNLFIEELHNKQRTEIMCEYSETQVISWLHDFYLDKNFETIKDLYSNGSYSEILSVGRRELSHSSFLAWLLDMNSSHGLSTFPLMQLLRLTIRRGLKENVDMPLKAYCSDIYNNSIVISEMSVKTEVTVTGGRVDIEVCCKALIGDSEKTLKVIIENKVYSDEHDQQTCTYYKHYTNGKKNEILVFIYLTPKHTDLLDLQDSPSCCKRFVEINYQDILEEILEPSLDKNINERTKFIINEYIRCLGMPVVDFDNQNGPKNAKTYKYTIMATSKEVSKMLGDFWVKHENLLIAVMATLANDPNQDTSIRESAEEMLNAAAAGKDKTRYGFRSEVYKGKNKIVVAVLTHLIRDKDVSAMDLMEKWKKFLDIDKKLIDFNTSQQWTMKTHPEYTDKEIEDELQIFRKRMKDGELILEDSKDRTKIQSFDHNYSMIEIENKKYYYYNQWGWKNIDFFIKFYRDVYMDKNSNEDIVVFPD